MKVRRVRPMGLAEIAYRGRQEASKWLDCIAPRFGPRLRSRLPVGDVGGDEDGAAAFELFRDAAPRRFFAGLENGDASDVLRERLPGACREVVDVANRICARRFDLLGYEGLSFGEAVDWHLDPIAARRAPLVHWSRIDPLDASTVGDSKVTWELNRHQWLIPLAQAYWLTDDQRYAREAADLVADWATANPYGIGINWSSSLEVAYRVISWTWAFMLLRDAGVFSAAEFSGLATLIRAHAFHIERYLSRYFSPNTHLTGEALGLFYVGVLFPEFAESPRWRRLGRRILIEECDRQIHRDGVYFEQTTCYQRYTAEIYLHFLILADRNEIAVPRVVRQRVERLLEFLLAVNAPDGAMPQIGDADGGWLLPLTKRGPSDCRGVFAIAAVVFGRTDFAWAGQGPPPELLWLLGLSGWNDFANLRESPPAAPPSRHFAEGGYAVMRSGWTRDAHHLILDVGPLGCPTSSAHGHADLLSLQCSAFGEPYLVDSGTYCYNPDIAWRNYFRGTTAHSTVVVDGQPQAEPAGPFSWRTRPSARILAWQSNEFVDYVDASHDAYSRLADPVVHRRRVLFVKPRFWVIVDDLLGSGVHDVDLRFQFGPRPVQVECDLWVAARGRAGKGLWLAPFTQAPMVADVREGQTDPVEGWVSTDYGRLQPAPAVVYSGRATLPLRMATLLFPTEDLAQGPPRVNVVRDAAGQPTSLTLVDTGETVRFDDVELVLEPAPQVANAKGVCVG